MSVTPGWDEEEPSWDDDPLPPVVRADRERDGQPRATCMTGDSSMTRDRCRLGEGSTTGDCVETKTWNQELRVGSETADGDYT